MNFKKVGEYGAILVGIYLVVVHGSGAASVLKNGASGGAQLVSAFQGRAS